VNRIWRRGALRYLFYLNIAIALSYVGLILVAARQDLLWRADFTAYYTGAAMIRDGNGARLYDIGLQTEYQQGILGQRSFLGGLLPYNTPPHFALFLLPLAYLPLPAAFWVWTLVNALMTAWVLLYVWRFTGFLPGDQRWLFLSSVLALPSLFRTFLQGTSSLVALLCVLQVYQAMKDGNAVCAGAGLTVGTLRPQSVFPIGFFALAQKRWRILTSTAVLTMSLVGMTSVFLGPQIWLDFLAHLGRVSSHQGSLGVYLEAMPNLRGVLSLMLGPDKGSVINTLGWSGFFLYLLAMVWLWLHRISSDSPLFELKLAVGLALGVFFSFHMNPHDALLLVVPILLILRYQRARELPTRPAMICLAGGPLFLLVSEFLVPAPFKVIGPVAVTLGLVLWGSFLLYGDAHKS